MKRAWLVAARGLARNRRRNLVTALAIAFGYAAVLMVVGYGARIEALFRTNTVYMQHLGHIAVFRDGGLEGAEVNPSRYSLSKDEESAVVAALRADPRVEIVGRYLQGTGLVGNGCKTFPFRALGVELDVERRLLNHPQVRRWSYDLLQPDAGVALPEASGVADPVAITRGVAKVIGKHPGPVPPGLPEPIDCAAPDAGKRIADDPVVQLAGLTLDGSLGAVDGTVVNVHPSPTKQWDVMGVTLGIETLQRLQDSDRISYVAAYLHEARDTAAVAAALQAKLAGSAKGLAIHRFDDPKRNPFYVGTIGFLFVLVTVIGLLIAAVVSLSVLNAMTLSFIERSREIGTMRSIGFTRRQVLGLLARETAILAAVAVAAGAGVGFGAAALINGANIRYTGPGWATTFQFLILPPPAAAGFVAALFIGLAVMAAYIAVRRRVAKPVVDLLTNVSG